MLSRRSFSPALTSTSGRYPHTPSRGQKKTATIFGPLCFIHSAEKGVRRSAINQFLDGGDLQCEISKLWVCSFRFSPYFRSRVVAAARVLCRQPNKQAPFSPSEQTIRRFRASSPFKF